MENAVNESLILECRKKLRLTLVESVDAFTDEMLKLTVSGEKVIIKGENLKILQFSKDSGNFSAEGTFYSVLYQNGKKPILKRILK